MTTSDVSIQHQTPAAVITAVEDILEVRQMWVASKEQELATVEAALAALRQAKGTEARIRRTERRVAFLRKVIRVLKAGYIPIPRFEISGNAYDLEEMPIKALTAINEAQAAGVFDRICSVAGRQPWRHPYGRRRQHARDPLIVGMVSVDAVYEERKAWNGSIERIEVSPLHEEQFLIAWWRPEDIPPEALF